jgi:GTP cyclohydrolase II
MDSDPVDIVLAEISELLETQVPETKFSVLKAKKQTVNGINWFLSVNCDYGEVVHVRVYWDRSKYHLVALKRGMKAEDEIEYFDAPATYDYRGVHDDLEHDRFAGSYGWDNAAYHAIAEQKAGVDLHDFHGKRTPDECYMESFVELLRDPRTQEKWSNIVTFDPFGMTATRPTIASTTAFLNIPELKGELVGGDEYGIVNDDGSINTVKAGVYYSWNLPALAERLSITEKGLRESLFKYTRDTHLLDPKIRTFLPQVGGFTLYTFGDVRKIRDPKTKIAVRVHDECNGSDVFGTDICTCRPYLVFALKAAVECAQAGGVGVVVYFRKEGRSLGEVTKYRVYNARKHQSGGDTAEKYFFQTESIAGIRDARFQPMMPDVLNWLGINRIDWLLSMSNEKYDAIVAAGVKVDQRLPLPDMYVPAHAEVEISAKIASGYHAEDCVDTLESVRDEILGLRVVRGQCQRLYELGVKGELEHFAVDESKYDACADFVIDVTKRRYPDLKVEMHSRMRHFPAARMAEFRETWAKWGVDEAEVTRRIIDLTFVSVLLDAGAGADWKYLCKDGTTLSRSEGIAVASLDMFENGVFSSDTAILHRVNSFGLKKLTARDLQVGFQVTESNPMVGLKGRAGLMRRLGGCLNRYPDYFGYEVRRPGNILNFVLRHATKNADGKDTVSVHVLWEALSKGLVDMWPERAYVLKKGDVWFHPALKEIGKPGSDAIAFHKLQQWLAYSVIEVLVSHGIVITDMQDMTALAEYRNGGLLIDMGVLVPKGKFEEVEVGSMVTVEWRALTISAIDKLAEVIRTKLGMTVEQLPLAMILEGGTWQAGREVARDKRGGLPPISINSDGTVF